MNCFRPKLDDKKREKENARKTEVDLKEVERKALIAACPLIRQSLYESGGTKHPKRKYGVAEIPNVIREGPKRKYGVAERCLQDRLTVARELEKSECRKSTRKWIVL